jgi:manganese/zinc/iron transport system substrate-binding protein
MSTNKFLIIMLFSVGLLISACAGPADSAGQDLGARKIQVVATTGMIGDIVENVGGERVEVTGLMGPGIDPHVYKATAGDVQAMEQADVIFYNGLHLEAAMAGVLERMQDRRTVVAVTDGIDRSVLIAPEQFEGAYDPHVWFDVTLWMQAVQTVYNTLSEMDPGSADLYRENAEAYLEELSQLHAYVQEQAGRVTAEKRVIITAHDAFNYFGRAYGFEVRGLQGISTATEASTGDVQQLANFIVEREIPAIFIESSVSERNVQAVQAAVRAQGFEVKIGGELFSDAMGNPGTPEGTYIGMVRHNVDTVVNALVQSQVD